MVSIIPTQNVSVTADVQTPAVDKVNAVAASHSLPQDGKKLPQDNHKQTETAEGDIEQVVDRMNDHVQQVKRELEFKIDEDSGRTVITVLDSDTQEIIRQIPGDEALHFARKLQQDDELELFDKFV
jgi:flagellar protein FlaG